MSQQKFINRKNELSFLKKAYTSGNAGFIVIYGRRRVGKTELILEFLKKRNGIYFLASTEGDRENMSNFKRKIAEVIGDENFLRINFTDWFSLFDSLFKNIKFLDMLKKEKFIIAMDEFPFLIYSNPSIPSVFQRVWELVLKNKKVMLILLGSSVSVIEEKVLGHDSPLYGRRTGQWELQPLSFINIKDFLPNYDIEDLAKVWFVVGGIPEYILKLDPKKELWSNIRDNIIKKGSYMYREAEILLREEFREPKNYVLIFKAIALGKVTAGEICNFTGLDKSMVSKYLETLKNLGIVREEIPITASSKFRRRLYFIVDPYFNFWFRYVYPNKIDLEAHKEKEVLSQIKKEFSDYSGFMFENLIEHLIREKVLLTKFSFTKIGRWWHKDKEIDIMALNEPKKEILFVECKWQHKVNARKIFEKLKEKAGFVEWNKNKRKEYYAIFAKSFKKKIKEPNLGLFDLKDIETFYSSL